MPSSDEWMSTNEACVALGITLRTLYRLIDGGEIPAYKIGRVIRLKADDVNSFINSARIQPGELEHLYPETKPGN